MNSMICGVIRSETPPISEALQLRPCPHINRPPRTLFPIDGSVGIQARAAAAGSRTAAGGASLSSGGGILGSGRRRQLERRRRDRGQRSAGSRAAAVGASLSGDGFNSGTATAPGKAAMAQVRTAEQQRPRQLRVLWWSASAPFASSPRS